MTLKRILSSLYLLFAILLVSSTTGASAASFDCAKAATPVERTICSNPQLSSFDEEMAEVYRPLAQSSRPTILSQRDWLRYGRNTCKDQACLMHQYQSRIAELKAGTHLHWAERAMPDVINGTTAFAPGSVVFTQVSPELRFIAQWVKDNNIIDQAYQLAHAKYNYPASLKISASLCQTSNAFYLAEQDAVFICYELINDIYQRAFNSNPTDNASRTVRTARFITALNFVVLHELGHAALHNRGASPSFADKENEADNFSYVLLIEKAKTEDEILIQTYGVQYALNAFEHHYSLQDLSDVHELPLQRFFKYVCLASARSPSLATQAIQTYKMARNRIATCQSDWPKRRAAAAALMRK